MIYEGDEGSSTPPLCPDLLGGAQKNSCPAANVSLGGNTLRQSSSDTQFLLGM